MKFCLPQALATSKHTFKVIFPKYNLTLKYYIKTSINSKQPLFKFIFIVCIVA